MNSIEGKRKKIATSSEPLVEYSNSLWLYLWNNSLSLSELRIQLAFRKCQPQALASSFPERHSRVRHNTLSIAGSSPSHMRMPHRKHRDLRQ